MSIKTFVALLFILLPFSILAQHEDCGTEMTQEDIININKALQETLSYKDRSPGDSTVPIKFHIIRNSLGTGGIDSADVFNELALVNSMYINAGIKFFHCGAINYIDDNQYMNFEKQVSETICDVNDLPNVLNVYFAPNVYRITSGNTVNLCGYAYSSSLTKNRIVMDNNCATNGSTLAHEIGHYFSLAHTHSTSAGAEFVNGSNCNFAGDQLCDTPADPGLSTLTVSTACNYTGTQTDGNNQSYTPNVRNIMSYSRKSCRTEFSAGQYARMNSYFFAFRNYLSCAPVSTGDITKKINLKIYPNPAEDMLYISSAKKLKSVTLYDQTGRIVLHKELAALANELDISTLKLGIFFYKIETTLGVQNGKIIKR